MDNFGKFVLPVVPFAFAYFGEDGWIGDSQASADAPENDKSMPMMFTKENCIPTSMGGKPISRHMMNKLGYLATIGSYLDRIGYPYGTERPDWSSFPVEGVAGYPKGAIISIYDENNKRMREYLSLTDNNTDTSPWDAVDGNQNLADYSDYDTQRYWDSNPNWKPLFKLEEANYFPDYSSKTELINESYYTSGKKSITLSSPGWLYIKRTISEFDTIDKTTLVSNPTAMSVTVTANDNRLTATTISPLEGKEATRLLPFGEGNVTFSVTNDLGIISEGNEEPAGEIQLTVYSIGFEQ